MSTDSSKPFDQRPLLVIALGGNALSPPQYAAGDYGVERANVARTGRSLKALAAAGFRLLVVHGNGPQVGRLLRSDPESGNLDIHVAQTQGELGYLLAAAVGEELACLITRVVVAPDIGPPVKPVGPVLSGRPSDATSVRSGDGWRITVPSPVPVRVVDRMAIEILLRTHHVVAGGGGGVPMTAAGDPVPGVVDKDPVATLLAIDLDATNLVFATDVDAVYERFGQPEARGLRHLRVHEARRLLQTLPAGSMAPKVASALSFAERTGRPAQICAVAEIEAALAGGAGTRVIP